MVGKFVIITEKSLSSSALAMHPAKKDLLSPVLAAIALALLQLLLELVAGDTLGLIFAIAFVVSGAFLDEPILFCGHAMMQRLSAFTGDGITMKQTTLWTGVISALSIIVGARHLSKKDLIR